MKSNPMWPTLLTHGLTTFCQFLLTGVLAVALLDLGYSAVQIGTVAAVFQIAMRCLSPVLGAWILNWGILPAYVASWLVGLIGFFLCGNLLGSDGFVAAIALLGLGLGMDSLCKTALIMERSGTKERTKENLSLSYILFNLGAAVGPAVAGALMARSIGLDRVFHLSGVIYALTCILLTFRLVSWPPSELNSEKRTRSSLLAVFRDREFWRFAWALPLVWSVFFLMHAMVPVFLRESTPMVMTEISRIFILNAVLVILCGHWVTRKVDRLFERTDSSCSALPVAFGLSLMGLGIAILFAAPILGEATGYVFMTVFTLGEISTLPFIQFYVQDYCQARKLPAGPYVASATLLAGIGAGISNLLGSYLLEAFSDSSIYLFPTVFVVIAWGVSAYYAVRFAPEKSAGRLTLAAR